MNNRTIDRAVVLWRRMLESPKYDNMGDTGTPEERRHSGMSSMLATLLPKNNTAEVLDKFCHELHKKITEKTMEGGYCVGLHVDYGPDDILHGCAEAAGLKMQFPWKTNMWVFQDYVAVSNGYGAEEVFHYPLPDDRWLVTKLRDRTSPM